MVTINRSEEFENTGSAESTRLMILHDVLTDREDCEDIGISRRAVPS